MADAPEENIAIKELMQLWDFQNPEVTETQFKARLDDHLEDPEFKPSVLTQIARTYSLRREFVQSHEYLDQAEALVNEHTPIASTLLHLERGRAFNSNGEIEQALEQFRAAFKIADTEHFDDLAADAAHMLGIAEKGKRSERWNLIALAIAETSEDPGAQRWLGPLYNNLGWTYFDAGEFDKALNLFHRGVDYRKEKEQMLEWRIARWTVARTHREIGRTEEALAEQLKLVEEAEPGSANMGYICEELGELYLESDKAKSQGYFLQAYEILSQDGWLQANEKERLDRMQSLAGLND